MDTTPPTLHNIFKADIAEMVEAKNIVIKHFMHEDQYYLHLLEMMTNKTDSFLLLSVSDKKIPVNKLPFRCKILDYLESPEKERLEAIKVQLIEEMKLEIAKNGEDIAFPISAKDDLIKSFSTLKATIADHQKNRAIIQMAQQIEASKKHQKGK